MTYDNTKYEKYSYLILLQFLRIKINALVDENTLLLGWKTQREQEIVELRAQVSQLTSDRLEAQNTLLVSVYSILTSNLICNPAIT